MRRDFVYLLAILLVALGVRLYPAWESVFDGTHVNFLETDAWYHIRLIENQVRNWPWRVTLDPYAAPGGQFVPIAPFFDTITATAVRLVHGSAAATADIERLAAFIPPALGGLAIVALWALAHVAFDRRAALVAAALASILPGHFMDRTQLGFYDHHALEALLAVTTLLTIGVALGTPRDRRLAALAGLSLGLYLLSWGSGAFLVAMVGGWLLLLVLLARSSEDLAAAGRVAVAAALVALALVLAFQDSRMFRYESQLIGLVGLAAIGVVVHSVGVRLSADARSRATAYAVLGLLLTVAVGGLYAFSTGVLAQLMVDVRRLGADPTRMGVLEARPLFLYSGVWNWAQPWEFFRAGFYIGLVALLLFTVRVLRDRRPLDLLIWVTTAAMFAATYGQNRFGYYLVPMCALVGGWLASQLLDWGTPPATRGVTTGRTPVVFRREMAILAIAAGMFAPSLAPSALLAPRLGSLPTYWRDALESLRAHSAPPFAGQAAEGDDYYYARYPSPPPAPDYAVMNWWDHGYWVMQIARRVPVANPTQERASNAARFYASTSEAQALERLVAERARYVISDWELPFRYTDEGAIMGRFQNVVDWASGRHADYYEVMYRRTTTGWTPVWVFFEPYYQSMTFRLSVLGGAAAVPVPNSTSVIVVGERVDSTGMRFREIESETKYSTHAAAVAAASQSGASDRTLIVGLDPWNAAFPVEALTHLREVYAARNQNQSASVSPWVRVFQVSN